VEIKTEHYGNEDIVTTTTLENGEKTVKMEDTLILPPEENPDLIEPWVEPPPPPPPVVDNSTSSSTNVSGSSSSSTSSSSSSSSGGSYSSEHFISKAKPKHEETYFGSDGSKTVTSEETDALGYKTIKTIVITRTIVSS